MQNFTSLLLDFTKEYESPTSFWKWSSYAIIAGLLRDNICLKHNVESIYPNIYVLLTADSGISRKGPPIALADSLLTLVKTTKIIKGRNSIQYVQDRLSQDGIERANGVAIKGGSGILLAPELSSFFVNDPSLAEIMSDMYDFKAEFPVGLKSNGGSVIIKNLCFSMLGASNETFLREVYTLKAIYGGLLRRTFMVEADEQRPGKSLFELARLPESNKAELIESLKQIATLRGLIKPTPEAELCYDVWYQMLHTNFKKKRDRTGFMASCGTLVLKLAMIIAASNYTTEITKENIQQAIEEVLKLKPAYEKYAMSTGKSNQAEIGSIILNDLWAAEKNKLSRVTILSTHWGDISAEDLDTLVSTLEQAGMIKTTFVDDSVGYQMTPACREIFESKEIK